MNPKPKKPENSHSTWRSVTQAVALVFPMAPNRSASFALGTFMCLTLLVTMRHGVFAQDTETKTSASSVDATDTNSEPSALVGLSAPLSGVVDTPQLHKGMQKFAEQIRVYGDQAKKRKAKLHNKPIFRWSNPERKAVAGNLFLWTIDGRPQASMGVWCDRGDVAKFEMQSFGESQFKIDLPGESWIPPVAGLKFARLTKADPPAGTKTRRTFQMRTIINKRFRAQLYTEWYSTRSEQLRGLPKPIYQYKELPKGVVDGAMYSFATGTDPEVLVILEARESDEGLVWFFAVAPSTANEVKAYLDDGLVFHRFSGTDENGSYLARW